MSRPTIIVPLSDRRVETGYLLNSARTSFIGRFRLIRHRIALAFLAQFCRDKPPGIIFEFLNPNAVLVDLGLDVAIRRAGDPHADRARSAVARQPDDADVMREIFAAKLRADARLLGCRENLASPVQYREKPGRPRCPGSAACRRYLVDASFTVLRHVSAEVPPMTKAMW